MMKKFFILFLVISLIAGIATPLSAMTIDNSKKTVINDGGYISGVFKAVEDDWSCVITLKSNGSFGMEEEGEPAVYGTYTLSDKIEKGYTVYIYLYVDGNRLGQGTLAWPIEGGMCILIDGAIFYKQ